MHREPPIHGLLRRANVMKQKHLYYYLSSYCFLDFLLIDHSNGYIEFNDEPFDSSRLRNRPYVTKLGKV